MNIVPVIRHRARYDFIEFVRPEGYHAYSIEQRFGVLRWMLETAAAIQPTRAEAGRWEGVSGPLELLSKAPTCVNPDARLSVCALDDLDQRFHYALLSRWAGTSAIRWRCENGIDVAKQKLIAFPHYSPFDGAPLQAEIASEAQICAAIGGLLGTKGALATQLNPYHAAAVEIVGVRVEILPQGFRFVLDYGYDGSVWHEELAATPDMWTGQGDAFRYLAYGRNSEPFVKTLDRAIYKLNSMLPKGGTE